jgi:hypothetical protein
VIDELLRRQDFTGHEGRRELVLVRGSALERMLSPLGLDGELVAEALLYRAGMDRSLADQAVERLVEVLVTMSGEQN